MLKHLLIRPLALELLCASQMSNQMINMLDFSETLITLGLDAKTILLNIWLSLVIFSNYISCDWQVSLFQEVRDTDNL